MVWNRETAVLALDDVIRHSVDGASMVDFDRHVATGPEGCERITGISQASMLDTLGACTVDSANAAANAAEHAREHPARH